MIPDCILQHRNVCSNAIRSNSCHCIRNQADNRGKRPYSRGDSSSCAGCILPTVWLCPVFPSQPLCCSFTFSQLQPEHPRNMGGPDLWDVGDIDLLFRVLDTPQSFWGALSPAFEPCSLLSAFLLGYCYCLPVNETGQPWIQKWRRSCTSQDLWGGVQKLLTCLTEVPF